MASTQARWEGEMASKRPRQLRSRSVKTEMYMNGSVHDKDEGWWLVSHTGELPSSAKRALRMYLTWFSVTARTKVNFL